MVCAATAFAIAANCGEARSDWPTIATCGALPSSRTMSQTICAAGSLLPASITPTVSTNAMRARSTASGGAAFRSKPATNSAILWLRNFAPGAAGAASSCARLMRGSASDAAPPRNSRRSIATRQLPGSQEPRRPHDGAPHVRGRAVVEAQAFLRLLEVAADDVDEVVEMDLGVRIERVDVVERDQPRGHVPLVRPRALVLLDDVGFGRIVGPEEFHVELGIFVADRL